MKWLILIPTKLERDKLQCSNTSDIRVEVCGFGLVAAAANASRFIARFQPDRVALCGIAGALSDAVEIGSAYQFRRVGLFGVGVGHGSKYLSAEQLGWKQWDQDGIEISTELAVDFETAMDSVCTCDLLVSCCAASAQPGDAEFIRSEFPDAMAEDMEGFAVATAAKLAATPIHIIRGISNIAGNRDRRDWKIDDAMQQVSRLVHELTGRTE